MIEHFFKIVNSDNINESIAMLKTNPELANSTDESGNTPLIFARSKTMIEVLLRHGADVNVHNIYERTLLHFLAFCYEDINDIIDLVVSNGADINTKDSLGRTPLHIAADEVNIEAVKCYVNHGADMNAVDNDGRTPLQMVIEDEFGDWLETATYLVNNGARIQKINEAIAVGNEAWINAFIKNNPEMISSMDSYGHTPLEWAIYYERDIIVDLLLKHGAKE